jgi:hypothetical protein
MLFPDPATATNRHQWLKTVVQETRTFTMYPKKTACLIPVLESAASGKPHSRFARVDTACNDVIF